MSSADDQAGVPAPSAGLPSQTQPEVTSLIDDIFRDNDDDDDDDDAAPSTNKVVDTDLIDSGDEGAEPAVHAREKKPKNRLGKHKSSSSSRQNQGNETSSSSFEGEKAGADDYKFIDSDDDADAGLMQEYKSDRQHNDYDEGYGHSAKKRRTEGGEGSKSKGDDPLSKTLDAMQKAKQKTKELNDEQKAQMATNIMQLMDKAYKDDELLREQGKPAVNKLMLLTQVQHVCNLKPIQFSLLEYDILTSLNMWMQPIDNGKNLPALSLRLSLYEILLGLPVQSDHLKKSGIGKTVLALRRHKLETAANKKILKAIMEKWSRFIFNKSADTRDTHTQRITQEQHGIARARQEAKIRELDAAAKNPQVNPYSTMDPAEAPGARAASRSNVDEESGFDENGDDAAAGGGNALAEAINGEGEVVDHRQRVRMPYNTGFYFTVRPESKVSSGQSQRNRQAEEDLEIDTETGAVIGRSSGGSKSQVPDTYQNRLSKQITELKKKSGVMGLGVKKPFKLQLK